MNPEHYHLTPTAGGRLMMQGWWGSEKTACRQFSTWIGERGALPGTRIILTYMETGQTLLTWPERP
ncbi:hypothetical protein [Streptomyces sp. NPDC006739]|uniref:hypothetical protein n=1 Tax=Streptomyces sp. NPDC006739 TaxID=3364763 RepID=UPI00368EF440